MANPVEQVVRPVDRWQQRTPGVRFVFAVVKKFGDDRGGTLAALVTFYGFLSLFPLLLVASTILAYALHGDPSLQRSLQRSALSEFPINAELVNGHLHGNVFALVFGLLSLLWGALGVSQMVQFGINEAWSVPNKDRPPFLVRILRGVLFFCILGGAVVGSTALAALGAIVGSSLWAGAVGVAGAIAVNAALFLAVFTIMGPKTVGWRDHLAGAVVAGVGWWILQDVGQELVRHNLKNTQQFYGQFAIVLGLLSFLSLASQLVMYAIEINVVRYRKLYPRSIVQPPLLPADRQSLALRAEQDEIRPEQKVAVRWSDTASDEPKGAPVEPADDAPTVSALSSGDDSPARRPRPLRAPTRSMTPAKMVALAGAVVGAAVGGRHRS